MRNIITVVSLNVNEKDYDHTAVEELEEIEDNKKEKAESNPGVCSQKKFTDQMDDIVLSVIFFEIAYDDDKKNKQNLDW